MKPAPSIIGFTTLSGLGYGMLIILALGSLFDLIPTDRWLGIVALVMSLGSITAGLLSSTLHLGHPERAWRAISQWRSSWLSREGLMALITYVPALLFAAGWIVTGTLSTFSIAMAILAALGAIATVYCTGMIYASLPPVRAWHQPLTAPIYLAFAAMTGSLAVHFIVAAFGAAHHLLAFVTLVAVVAAFILKILYWQTVSMEASTGPSRESATGLGAIGLVRMLDPPHTQTNYLLDEMGFQIGRKHARVVRQLTFLFGLFLPVIFTLLSMVLEGWLMAFPAFLAFASGMVGVLLERWLFFAEAEHTVMLYYGDRQIADQPVPGITASVPALTPSTVTEPARRRRRAVAPKRRRDNIKPSVEGDQPVEPLPEDRPKVASRAGRRIGAEQG